MIVVRAVSGELSYANSFIAIDDTVNFKLTDAVPNLLFWNMTHTIDQVTESIIGLIPIKPNLQSTIKRDILLQGHIVIKDNNYSFHDKRLGIIPLEIKNAV